MPGLQFTYRPASLFVYAGVDTTTSKDVVTVLHRRLRPSRRRDTSRQENRVFNSCLAVELAKSTTTSLTTAALTTLPQQNRAE
jgi:hypothetical protein